MVEERKIELLHELPRRPVLWDPVPPWVIHWDPVPPWVNLDDKLQRQFAQMELKFMKMELDIQQQKLQEFGKILGTPTS